ncbi:hypothetical protein HJG60_010031 [Phyllostomus discolor]|uniref:Uncharacterized protein n=1 Tax=Phyllostomus discolor TaxID=89673 RepID=A0A834EG08_9CHIR|nr:hypothetical protein HJG60_010031 [Phyllostomus discolor]
MHLWPSGSPPPTETAVEARELGAGVCHGHQDMPGRQQALRKPGGGGLAASPGVGFRTGRHGRAGAAGPREVLDGDTGRRRLVGPRCEHRWRGHGAEGADITQAWGPIAAPLSLVQTVPLPPPSPGWCKAQKGPSYSLVPDTEQKRD